MGLFSGRWAKLKNLQIKSYAWLSLKLCDHGNLIMFIGGTITLICGLNELSHAGGTGTGTATAPIDTTELVRGTCTLFYLIEGAYGALLATTAGLGAIVSSAFGQYRAAYNFLIVSISSFILRAMVSLWFGIPDNTKCLTLLHKTGGVTPPGPSVPDPLCGNPGHPAC